MRKPFFLLALLIPFFPVGLVLLVDQEYTVCHLLRLYQFLLYFLVDRVHQGFQEIQESLYFLLVLLVQVVLVVLVVRKLLAFLLLLFVLEDLVRPNVNCYQLLICKNV